MKKHYLVAALVGTASLPVFAQSSVTLYGVIDTNLEFLNHADATGGTLVRMNSGGLSNSRIGFKGTEDLGGGYSAFFWLEAGYNSNDGTNATSGVLFNRQAAVGVSNASYGALSAGLQYTAMYDILEQYDPMGYAPQYTWFPTTGSADDFSYKARLNNSVKYVGQFGGLKAIANYSFGGDAGSFQSSAAYGAGLQYAIGTFSAAFAYDYRNGAINTAGTWTKTRNWSLSARNQFGAATVMGGYEHYLNDPTKGASVSAALWFGGMRYRVTPAVQLTTAVYYQSNKTKDVSNSIMGVVSGDYSLSKRTDLYATVAYAAATRYANGTFTPVGVTDETAFGANQTGVTVGIRHRF
ncbi:porin [Paraburkholderia monticola]|uniref:Porin n=1 Tax=Paraburkholderia monticola TaxID=1399968 RepID=A0A149PD70_9BURK|nr:porin [Paraburkholderia monticola]KXU82991.1 porin [Paraburkholderia monticola]